MKRNDELPPSKFERREIRRELFDYTFDCRILWDGIGVDLHENYTERKIREMLHNMIWMMDSIDHLYQENLTLRKAIKKICMKHGYGDIIANILKHNQMEDRHA